MHYIFSSLYFDVVGFVRGGQLLVRIENPLSEHDNRCRYGWWFLLAWYDDAVRFHCVCIVWCVCVLLYLLFLARTFLAFLLRTFGFAFLLAFRRYVFELQRREHTLALRQPEQAIAVRSASAVEHPTDHLVPYTFAVAHLCCCCWYGACFFWCMQENIIL